MKYTPRFRSTYSEHCQGKKDRERKIHKLSKNQNSKAKTKDRVQ